MIYRLLRAKLLAILFIGLAPTCYAQVSSFKISTIERKPFAFKVDDKWTGLSIDLWELLAE